MRMVAIEGSARSFGRVLFYHCVLFSTPPKKDCRQKLNTPVDEARHAKGKWKESSEVPAPLEATEQAFPA